jgi:peptidoglycan/LPS O-acetylase OafA/YrhL
VTFWLTNNGQVAVEDIRLNSFLNLSLIVQFPVFLFGFLAFSLVSDGNISSAQAFIYIAFGLIGISLGWLFFPIVLRSVMVPWFAGLLTLGLVCFFKNQSSLIPFLIRRLGKVSYSVYLFHFLVAWSAPWLTLFQQINIAGLIFHVCITLAVSYFLAEVSYKFIEVPGQAFGKRLFQSKRLVANL